MRPQAQLLIKGTQIVAAFTAGVAVLRHQTTHISKDDLVHHEPVKDVLARPQVGHSSNLFHSTPIQGPKPPGRSSTISSIKSTTTIRSFLIGRGLAHNLFKQPAETWPQDILTQEGVTPSEDRHIFAAHPKSSSPKASTQGDLFVDSNEYAGQALESVGGQDARRNEEDEGNSETDSIKENLLTLPVFPVHRLAWQLHQQSISLFAELSSFLEGNAKLRNHAKGIRDDLGRLSLWGESFGGGRLDDILADSDELRMAILELYTTIGKILVNDIVPSVESLGYSITERSNHLLEVIQQAEKAGDNIYEASYHMSRTDEIVQGCESSRSMADALQILGSSVDCLMRLLPTIEKTMALT